MNLVELKRSRKLPQPGDVFVFVLKQYADRFWFGRVIRTDSSIGIFKNTVLVYLYNLYSSDKQQVPTLSPDKLLVPPIHTNNLPWSRGFFVTLDNKPLTKEEVLPAHHFKNPLTGQVFDADSKPVVVPGAVVGEFSLHSYKTIDDAVCRALGIPLFEE